MRKLGILILLCMLIGLCAASVRRIILPAEDRKYFYQEHITGDYTTQTGDAFELDGNNDLMPVNVLFHDFRFDLDGNDDIMPAPYWHFTSDNNGDLMPTP